MDIETYIGFDVGKKRTGVAIANSITKVANGIGVVKHYKDGSTNWDDIDKIIKRYNPQLFIVGLALHNGNMQEISYISKSFAKKLTLKYHTKVLFIDENLSSKEAKTRLKWSINHKNANKGEIDKLSAEIILQTWLNSNYI